MGWLQRTFRSVVQRAAKYAGIPLRDPALVAMLGSQPTSAGVDVDEGTAMNYSAVWAATGIISSNMAAFPALPYRQVGEGFEEATDHWSHRLLTVAPNAQMTPYTFTETIQAHALTWGNGYALLDRDEPESPIEEMHIIPPNQITPLRNDDTGEIYYRFQGMYPGERDEEYQPWEIMHLAGIGFDGLKGYPVIQMGRESIGLSMAAEKYGGSFFGRGSVPGGILEVPEGMELTEKAKKNLRESFELLHRGPDNAHRVGILENGIGYKPLGLPPEAAQFLQTRQFGIVEVARWFNLPPHLLRDLLHATYSNIEHQGIDFLVYTLRPWMIRWAQTYRRHLFNRREQAVMSVHHDPHNLLMTDITARYNAYRVGREGGWSMLDEVRRKEGLNPLGGKLGQSFLVPQNMRAVDADGRDIFVDEKGLDYSRTAFNGPQIVAMTALIQAAGAGSVHADSAEQLLVAAFPHVKPELIEAIMKPIRDGKVQAPALAEPAKPEPPEKEESERYTLPASRINKDLAASLFSRALLNGSHQ